MPLLAQSFDAITSDADLIAAGWSAGALLTYSNAGANGSARCLTIGQDDGGGATSPTFTATSSFSIQFYHYAATPGGERTLLEFRNGSTAQILVKLTTSNTLKIYNNATLLATSAALTASTWHSHDIKILISDSAGRLQWTINGELAFNLSEIDTRYNADTIDNINLRSITGWRFDELTLDEYEWPRDANYLLLESGDKILQESGFGILLEDQTFGDAARLTNEALVQFDPDLQAARATVEALINPPQTLNAARFALEALISHGVLSAARFLIEYIYPAPVTYTPAPFKRQAGLCGLLEIDAADGTLYFSNRAFISQSFDEPASTAYLDTLLELPRFERSLGATPQGQGSFKIIDHDGTLIDENVALRPFRFYLGRTDQPKMSFTLVLQGWISRTGWNVENGNILSLNCAGGLERIDEPIVSDGNFYPVAFGQCFNVTPKVYDSANLIYSLHPIDWGGIQAISAVRDGGIAYSDSEYIQYLTLGGFQITGAAPTSDLTVDLNGGKFSHVVINGIPLYGLPVDNAATMVYAVLLLSGYYGDSNINNQSFIDLYYDKPQKLGLYVEPRKEYNLLQIIREILDSLELYLREDSLGRLSIGAIPDPLNYGGNVTLELADDDMHDMSFRLIGIRPPVKNIKLGWRKNYTPGQQTVSGVTPDYKELYTQEFTWANGDQLLPGYNNALNLEIKTLIANQSDAVAEVARRLAARALPQKVYRLRASNPLARALLPGDVVNITSTRYGFTAGQYALVESVAWETDGVSTEIVVSR